MNARGFTLLEVLLAIAIVAMIALGVATMLASVLTATQHQNDIQRSFVVREVATARLMPELRGASTALSLTGDHIVLWMGDDDESGEPGLSELLRIEWDADTESILTYKAPPDLDSASDTEYESTDDFSAITGGLVGSPLFVESLLLTNISSWDVALNDPDPLLARLIRVELDIHQGGSSERASVVTTFRCE